MVWVGRDLRNDLVPPRAAGRGTLPQARLLRAPHSPELLKGQGTHSFCSSASPPSQGITSSF